MAEPDPRHAAALPPPFVARNSLAQAESPPDRPSHGALLAAAPPFVPGASRRESPIPPITSYAYDDQDVGSTSVHVAAQLEEIARRIRAGVLIVDGRPGMSEEAATAAALAALLDERR